MLPAVLLPLPAAPEMDGGDSDSLTLRARVEFGVVAVFGLFVVDIATVEFFLVVVPDGVPALTVPDATPDFLAARVDAPPPLMGTVAPEPLLRFLITSVFKDKGLTTP